MNSKRNHKSISVQNFCIGLLFLYIIGHAYFYSTLTQQKQSVNRSNNNDATATSSENHVENRRLRQTNADQLASEELNESEKNAEKGKLETVLADPKQFLTFEDIEKYYSNALKTLDEIVSFWPPESVNRPETWKNVVPRFDYTDPVSRQAAQMVRQAEKPFVIVNVPELQNVKDKWSRNYLSKKLGKRAGNVEVSETNSFMFWRRKGNAKNGPTSFQRMTWDAFLKEAKQLDQFPSPHNEHYYWHTSASSDQWIANDLKMFNKDNPFFIVDASEYTVPIACRVGTKGLCNENHYDTHRTFAAQIIGSKRWIFQPPSECEKMYLYPEGHISARHSAVDINAGHINFTKFPKTQSALAIETVIEAGEIGYLPSNWFHHIISQEFNIQCIARSGHSLEGDDYIEECGFAGGRRAMGKAPKKKSKR